MARWWRRSRAPEPLGNGVWRRAEYRFRRAVDRYHQVLERVEELAATAGRSESIATAPRSGVVDVAALQTVGAELAELLPRVHQVCLEAQALGSSDGEVIPAGPSGVLLDVHRALTRSATLVAQAAESLTMVLVTAAAGRRDGAAGAELGPARAVEQAAAQVATAESLLDRRDGRHLPH
jgi:hypothetical protein